MNQWDHWQSLMTAQWISEQHPNFVPAAVLPLCRQNILLDYGLWSSKNPARPLAFFFSVLFITSLWSKKNKEQSSNLRTNILIIRFIMCHLWRLFNNSFSIFTVSKIVILFPVLKSYSSPVMKCRVFFAQFYSKTVRKYFNYTRSLCALGKK